MSDIPSDGRGPLPAAVAPPSVSGLETTEGGGLLAMIERLALNPQLNMDVFDRLLAARRSEEDRAAERAFNVAMSNAKGELTPILKTHDVDFTGKSGTRTKYRYESFADVAKVVDPVFQRHGLHYRFVVAQQADLVRVTCIVSHIDGHSERNPLEGKVDIGSTGMSWTQALGSALSYLQRYSLRAAIGLAAGVDDDGKAAGGSSPKIDAGQANELQRLFDETGRNQAMVLKLVGVTDIGDMTVEQWMRAKEVVGLAKEGKRDRAPVGNDNAPATN
jgi:hypothetical protein